MAHSLHHPLLPTDHVVNDHDEDIECDSAPAQFKSNQDCNPNTTFPEESPTTPVSKKNVNQHKFIPILPEKLCSPHFWIHFQNANTVQMKIRKFKIVSIRGYFNKKWPKLTLTLSQLAFANC